MNEKQISDLIKIFDEIVEQLPLIRKQQIENLILKVGERYFTAPASSKIQHHDAEIGGLLRHSIIVYKNLLQLRNLWFPTIANDSIIITGLFHDIGKIGMLNGEDYYTPVLKTSWQFEKGIRYDHNLLKDCLSHAQRSVRLLSQCNVDLTDSEFAAILYHDGLYLQENVSLIKSYRSDALVIGLHWADYYTAFFDSKEK